LGRRKKRKEYINIIGFSLELLRKKRERGAKTKEKRKKRKEKKKKKE
jgi:hypothetical protein